MRETDRPHPIRVCFVIDNLSRAGTESQLLALINTLDRTRFTPSLVLLDGTPTTSRELEPDRCEIVRLGVSKLVSRRGVDAARTLMNFWRTNRPDIVQCYFLDPAYFAIPLAKWCGVPTILRVRNNLGYWLTPKHRLLDHLLRPWVDAMLTNTDAGRDKLASEGAVSLTRVIVIENGVDVERFSRECHTTPRVRPRVGMVGNLRPVKNVDGLMRVAEHILGADFVVAGEGEQRAELERLRTQLGLESRFELLGSVADVPRFLASLDVAVLPSHSEGMSNALLEYLAAGKAIVATDVGANARLVRDGIDGLIVPPNDTTALVAAIRRLLDDPQFAHTLATSARARVEREFSRDAMRRRFESLYAAHVRSPIIPSLSPRPLSASSRQSSRP